MDLGSVGGLVAGAVLIVVGILIGGPLSAFFDGASVVLVLIGTFAILYIGYPAGMIKVAMKGVKRALFKPTQNPSETVKLLADLANRARREGLLSLESAAEEAKDPFLARGLRLMVDGHEPATIETALFEEIAKTEERLKSDGAVWEGMGTYAPAMGMIGTLIGLVQMLGNLNDPTSVGPAMAVALLTTFYGSVMANLVGLPIANRLKLRTGEEIAHMELMAQGLLSILAGENPRFMIERLNATLPPDQRLAEAA